MTTDRRLKCKADMQRKDRAENTVVNFGETTIAEDNMRTKGTEKVQCSH